MSPDEWHDLLDGQTFNVTREKGTEISIKIKIDRGWKNICQNFSHILLEFCDDFLSTFI